MKSWATWLLTSRWGSSPLFGYLPWLRKNGEYPVDVCSLSLYEKVARDSQSTQSVCHSFMNIRRYCSISWFIRLVCMSVWGWYAVEMLVLVLTSWWRSFINWAANCGPRSLITFQGIPNCFHTLSQNSLAVPIEDISLVVGTAMMYLVNRSMTTIIASYPCDIGSPVMKSTVMCSKVVRGWHLVVAVHGFSLFSFLPADRVGILRHIVGHQTECMATSSSWWLVPGFCIIQGVQRPSCRDVLE